MKNNNEDLDENGMFRSKIGEEQDNEKRNNRIIMAGLFILLVGFIGFMIVSTKSCTPKEFH